jgi:hypothetical protein
MPKGTAYQSDLGMAGPCTASSASTRPRCCRGSSTACRRASRLAPDRSSSTHARSTSIPSQRPGRSGRAHPARRRGLSVPEGPGRPPRRDDRRLPRRPQSRPSLGAAPAVRYRSDRLPGHSAARRSCRRIRPASTCTPTAAAPTAFWSRAIWWPPRPRPASRSSALRPRHAGRRARAHVRPASA